MKTHNNVKIWKRVEGNSKMSLPSNKITTPQENGVIFVTSC